MSNTINELTGQIVGLKPNLYMKKALKIVLAILFGLVAMFVVVQSIQSQNVVSTLDDIDSTTLVSSASEKNSVLIMSDRDEKNISEAVAVIEACLDQEKQAKDCVGAYAFTCTTINCDGYEIEAWSDLSKQYLNILYKIDDLSEPLRASQESWEQYFNNECLFVFNYWTHNRIMGNAAKRACSLTFVAERALKLRNHVINLNQRQGDF